MYSIVRLDLSRRISLLVAASLIGCTGITDFERFRGPDDDAGGVDAGVMDADVQPDARVDAGPCEGTSDEVCNGDDDDCDGEVDEDFSLDTNPAHCGACNRVCPPVPNSEPGCADADCAPTCEGAFADCDLDYLTGCEASLDEAAHCGSCENDCGDMFCADGECVLDCPDDEEVCGTTCVDTQRDLANCGTCGTVCPAPANSVPICTTGSCGSTCMAGFADCDSDDTNGCETDLTTTSDCGTCGTVCNFTNAAAACTDEMCALTECNEGFSDCNTDPDDGCEIQLGTTEACTGCTDACPSRTNAVAVCGVSGCGFTCAEGWADCNGMPEDGCEASLASATSCGSCATSCTGATPLCEAGTGCVTGCTSPAVLCGGSCVDTDTSPLHCGACDDPCADPDHASPTCTGGTCGFECDVGWTDCNGDPLDGCERNTRTLSDCGGCGVACAPADASATCASGTCTVTSCDTGHGDCNGLPADGCEVDLLTIAACGTCTTSCTVQDGTPACVATGGGSCVVASCASGFGDCDLVYGNGCEASLGVLYPDTDGDGYGVTANGQARCPAAGFVATGGDCNDSSGAIHPGQSDACDGSIDHDCDNMIDEGCACTSGQTRPCGTDVGECTAGTEMCVGGAWGACMGAVGGGAEVCDDLDNDCDTVIDDGFACRIGTVAACNTVCSTVGQRTCGASCAFGACVPPAEVCDVRDDDCDTRIDEGQLGVVREFELQDPDVWTVGDGEADLAYRRDIELYAMVFATSPEGAVLGYVNGATGEANFRSFTSDRVVRSRIIGLEGAYALFVQIDDQLFRATIVNPGDDVVLTAIKLPGGWPGIVAFDAYGTAENTARVVLTDGAEIASVDVSATGDEADGVIFRDGRISGPILDLAAIAHRGMTALIVAEPGEAGVYYRRVDNAGNTRAPSTITNLLPADHVFDPRFSRNMRLALLHVGTGFSTDVLVAVFNDRSSAGVTTAHYAVFAGSGTTLTAAGTSTNLLEDDGVGVAISQLRHAVAIGALRELHHSNLDSAGRLTLMDTVAGAGRTWPVLIGGAEMSLGSYAATWWLDTDKYGFAIYGCAP